MRFPFTGEEYAQVCLESTLDLKNAVTEAVKSFEPTIKFTSGALAGILTRIADEIHCRSDELAEVLVMEGGEDPEVCHK
ncbi:MAG: aldehyde dehydrogenase family protein [Methanomicrobiales archaeon]